MTIIAVTAESQPEPRVAISPDTVKKYKALGCTVRVESGAGNRSRFSDAALAAAGADIMPTAAATLEGADILLKVRRPSPDERIARSSVKETWTSGVRLGSRATFSRSTINENG